MAAPVQLRLQLPFVQPQKSSLAPVARLKVHQRRPSASAMTAVQIQPPRRFPRCRAPERLFSHQAGHQGPRGPGFFNQSIRRNRGAPDLGRPRRVRVLAIAGHPGIEGRRSGNCLLIYTNVLHLFIALKNWSVRQKNG